MITTDFIYHVSFFEKPSKDIDRKDFFFGSLAAIYELFDAKQVGCRIENLWNVGVSDGKPYCNKLCRITKEPLTRKAHSQAARTSKKL